MDAVARNVAKFYPPPNTAGDPITGVNNFVRTDGTHTRKDAVSFRVDHYFSDRHRFFGRFSYDDSPINRALPYGPDFRLSSPASGPQTFSRRNVVVEDTYTFAPTLLATFCGSFSRLANFRTPLSNGFDMTTLGFPRGLQEQMGTPFVFPVFIVTGFGQLAFTGAIRSAWGTWGWQSNVTKSFARHTLKTGFEYRLIRSNLYQPLDAGKQFSFSNAWTQGPDPARSSPTAGFALASFLLGVGAGSVNIAPAQAVQNTYYAVFVQDDYKITPRLTLNLGLRYDYESPRTDRFNQLTNFDHNLKPPLTAPGLDLRGALTFVGVGGAPRFQSEPDRNNVAPRVGIAFKATRATALRAGAGIFFSASTGTGSGAGGFGTSGPIQNWNDLRADWAVSDMDQTHRLALNSVYELPLGKGRRGAAGKLLAGWEVGAIWSPLSGTPLAVTSAVNTTFAQGGGQRPNWTGVMTKVSHPAPDRWFDTSQFGNPEPYRFGNAPRTFADSRTDATVGWDLIAAKVTSLSEKLRLQFRAEFFNLPNTPRFSPPNTSFGNRLFGVSSGQANQPRIVQFGLKLLY